MLLCYDLMFNYYCIVQEEEILKRDRLELCPKDMRVLIYFNIEESKDMKQLLESGHLHPKAVEVLHFYTACFLMPAMNPYSLPWFFSGTAAHLRLLLLKGGEQVPEDKRTNDGMTVTWGYEPDNKINESDCPSFLHCLPVSDLFTCIEC